MGQVRNYKLFEIFNGHPRVNNLGGGGASSLEEVWDTILSTGMEIYGIAVDDAHNFKGPWSPDRSHPGRGWVVVRAPELSAEAILSALERGDFYASTGVELKDYQVTNEGITIDINTESSSKYRVQFIGRGGQILKEVFNNPALYEWQGKELYVRAKVIESNGKLAWTQPVFIGDKASD